MNFKVLKKLSNIFFKNYLISPILIYKNIKWRFPNKVSNKQYIFIIGAPRSGTTLIQSILSTNSKIYSFEGETAIFTKQNIFDVKRYEAIGVSLDMKPIFQKSDDVVSFFDNLVKASLPDGQVFLEKTPQHINHLDFLIKYFPKSKFIHVYRDGRDCYCSSRKFDGIPTGVDLNSYAKYWSKCIQSRLKMGKQSNIHDISYETFTGNPKQEITKLLTFLEIEFEEKMLNHKVYSNDKRANFNEFKKMNQPINRSSVGRWKNEMTDDEVHQFIELAGKELEELGYE